MLFKCIWWAWKKRGQWLRSHQPRLNLASRKLVMRPSLVRPKLVFKCTRSYVIGQSRRELEERGPCNETIYKIVGYGSTRWRPNLCSRCLFGSRLPAQHQQALEDWVLHEAQRIGCVVRDAPIFSAYFWGKASHAQAIELILYQWKFWQLCFRRNGVWIIFNFKINVILNKI